MSSHGLVTARRAASVAVRWLTQQEAVVLVAMLAMLLTVFNNTAVSTAGTSAGGGLLIMVSGGSQTLTNVTARGNASINQSVDQNNAGFAGGIGLVTPDATVTNSTLSGNSVQATEAAVGGGIAIATTDQSTVPTVVTLVNVTISANSATAPSVAIGGAGIFGGATLRFLNTIVTSASGANCGAPGGTLTSLGHNLEAANDCLFSGPGDLPNTDPGLLPLANNGGFTQTQALPPGSRAVNAGTNQGCPSTDQRGVPRPQGTACDIGAYELADATAVPLLDLPAMGVMALLMAGGALFALRRTRSA